MPDYDAVVVGSGPNGLAAAIRLQQQGLSVLLAEQKPFTGGGMRTETLTLPGFLHDTGSAVFPLAVGNTFLSSLPLQNYGLEWIYPEVAMAHPLANGRAVVVKKSIDETVDSFENAADRQAYKKLLEPLVQAWPELAGDLLAPLHIPAHMLKLLRFARHGLLSAEALAQKLFKSEDARLMFYGMAAHSTLPLSAPGTSAIGLVLCILAHYQGWPVPKGGAASIARALTALFTSAGGKLVTGLKVESLEQLPASKVVLLDVTPAFLLELKGLKLSMAEKMWLRRYRYGPGIFKIDWALNQPVPFKNRQVHKAGTVHLSGSAAQLTEAEAGNFHGMHASEPFVLFAQPSRFDSSRAPAGQHTAWAYCHVPHNSAMQMTEIIEEQVEKAAPGFREVIADKHTFSARQIADTFPNFVGGDINSGLQSIWQLFTRPFWKWSPHRLAHRGVYLCSSGTPPGGGVHGMCGYHAAELALRDCFGKKPADW